MTLCNLCGGDAAALVYALPNGDLVRCQGCGTLRRGNLVDEVAAEALYDDDAYLEAPYFEALKLGASREQEPFFVYQRVLERITEGRSPGTLLDVGCSYGAFLEMAAEYGWTPLGVDLSRKAVEYARRERGLNVIHGTLEAAALPGESVQAITLWDVIEHLDRPLDTLRELRRILAPGGVLMLFTINQQSLINQVGHLVYGATAGTWTKPLVLLYDIHHNFFFDEQTMRGMLSKARFDHVEFDWMEANIDRWQNVPIPPLLAWGTKALDKAAQLVGQPYRMIVFARTKVSDGHP